MTPSNDTLHTLYLKNIPAKFHPDPIWNDGALGYLCCPNKKKNNNKMMSSNMRSIPDPNITAANT